MFSRIPNKAQRKRKTCLALGELLISRRALAPRSKDSGSKPEALESSASGFAFDLALEVWSPSEDEEEEEKG